MTRSLGFLGSLILVASGAAAAQQQQAAPAMPAARVCQTTATQAFAAKLAAARTAKNTADVAAITAETKKYVRECIDKIPTTNAAVGELVALASAYVYTGDSAKARSLMSLLLTRSGTENERADALIGATTIAAATWDPFAGFNPDAERAVKELDGMSDAVIRQKVRGHQILLGRYGYADIDDGIRDHAPKLLALAKGALATKALGMIAVRNRPDSVNAAYPVIASAYSDLARGAGDFLHADTALAILDEASRLLGSAYPDGVSELESQRVMYRLIGTRAAPIDGKWWINAPNGSVVQPGDAKVTVIQFTATWCVPCRNSYPGFLRMNQHFAGKPVEAVMATQLYGFLGEKTKLTPAEEVTEDIEYYTKHHGLPFRIAINPAKTTADATLKDNDANYAVSGIPEIIVVDKKGIIRATVVGWDKGNEQRLTALIEKLLVEK